MAGRYFILAAWIGVSGVLGNSPSTLGQTLHESVRITQFDVGQGDAALVVTPEGKKILIDAGPNERDIVEYLLQRHVDTLDLVIASHNHADHIGGMAAVLRLAVVRAYLDNGVPHTTMTYRRTMAAVEAEQGLQYLAATDRSISVGTVKLKILPPARVANSQNNSSVGVLIEYGKFRALYTGDSERLALRRWLSHGVVRNVTLVKAAHHGSSNGVTLDFVRATLPRIVLISVGSNSYGHPAPTVERQWVEHGAQVYRTDRHGTIEVIGMASGEVFLTQQDRGAFR